MPFKINVQFQRRVPNSVAGGLGHVGGAAWNGGEDASVKRSNFPSGTPVRFHDRLCLVPNLEGASAFFHAEVD